MARDNSRQGAQLRQRIAQQAALLMVEHGIRDYALAKTKAARQLAVDALHGLPSNDEVDEALRAYHAVFVPGFRDQDLRAMLEQALEAMSVLDRFAPVLTGGLLTGSVSRHSDIELEVFLDSSKEFEHFLLNEGIAFKADERAGQSSYLLYAEPMNVRIRVLPPSARHVGRKGKGKALGRLSREQLRQLLETGTAQPD